MPIDNNERNLIEKAKSGDEDSFESLVLGCQERAYNIAYRYMKNEADAMDALQESLIKIFRYLKNFKGDSKFDTWVYRIVVNTCNDLLRKNSSLKSIDSLDSFYRTEDEKNIVKDIQDTRNMPENVIGQQEKSEWILQCLDLLKEEQRDIIMLRDIHGFSYEEISQILDCTIGTVKSRISRSRSKLREIMMEQNENKNV